MSLEAELEKDYAKVATGHVVNIFSQGALPKDLGWYHSKSVVVTMRKENEHMPSYRVSVYVTKESKQYMDRFEEKPTMVQGVLSFWK